MPALTLGNNVRNRDLSPRDRSDERLHNLVILRFVGDERDLASVNCVFALVALIEQRAGIYCSLRPHMLPVVFERRDETTVGPDGDERFHQPEPVLPPVGSGDALDSRQRIIVEPRRDVESGDVSSRCRCRQPRGRGVRSEQQRESEQRLQDHTMKIEGGDGVRTSFLLHAFH